MPGLGLVLLLSLLPGAGTLLGGLLALWVRPPHWLVGVALHAAAGVAIAVVSLELMPRALEGAQTEVLIVSFVAGAVTSIAVAGLAGRWRLVETSALLVIVASAIDLATDGLMTGAGSSIAAGLGVLLASSQVLGNVPNGFAAFANLADRASSARKLLLLFLLPLVAVVAALLGFVALRGASATVQAAALSFMGGMLLLATIEDTVSQGDAPSPPRRYSSLAFAAGFAMMMGMTELVEA